MRYALALFATTIGTAHAAAQAATSRHSVDDQAFVIEHQSRVVRFDSSGTGRIDLYSSILVQSEAGVRALGELAFDYDSAFSRLDIDTVEVRKGTGGRVLAPASAVQDVTGPIGREAPTYSDLRQKIITVPGLQPGDTIAYHLTWTIDRPLAPGEFWYSAPFIRRAVDLDDHVQLVVRASQYVNIKTRGGPAPIVTDSAGWRLYRWRDANLEIDTLAEPGKRPDGVEITSFRDWTAVATWYAGLERPREAATTALGEKAAELVRGKTSLADSIAALFAYVSQQIRYVSLSFGIGHYQPHAAADVMANAYGDCKDKHVLLASLLRSIGVASAPVLIGTEQDADSTLPTPLAFNHLITLVPLRTDTLWLDATPDVAPFRYLGITVRDRHALVIPADAPARLVRSPAVLPFPAFEDVVVTGAVGSGGDVSETIRYSMRGDEEVLLREVFREIPRSRWSDFARRLSSRLPGGGTSGELDAARPEDTQLPFWFLYPVTQAHVLTWQSGRTTYWPAVPSVDLPERDSSRLADSVRLDIVPAQSRTLALSLPHGVSAQLPIPVAITRDYASYHSSYSLRGDTVVVTRGLTLSGQRLPPARAADWEAFRRAVRDDEAQAITLVRAAGATEPESAPSTAGADQTYQAGVAALNSGDARTAVTLLRQVVVLQPNHQWAWNNLGRALMQLGELDSAATMFRRQIAVNPYDQYAYNNLGLALWRAGNLTGAVTQFQKQIEINPLDQFAHTNLGRLRLDQHRDSDAVQELRQAVVITSTDGSVRADLGRAWLRLHQTDSAVAAFDRAVEISPTPATWNTVAYALAASGERLDRAEVYARSAIDATAAILRTVTADQAGPRETFAAAQLGSYWDTLGWIEFREGKIADAEHYVRAGWLLVRHAEIGDHLAQIYQSEGRRADAIRTLALALNASNPLPETRERLATLVGDAGRAAALADSGRQWLVADRTVTLDPVSGVEGVGTVRVVATPGSKVESVRLVSGPEGLQHVDATIRRATLPILFPDTTAIKLPLEGVVTCSPRACSLVLLAGGVQMRPLVR